MKLSLSQMATLLLNAGSTISRPIQHALEDAADLVLNEARSMPGEYQSGAGPFPDWQPLADYTLAEKAKYGWPVPSPLKRTGGMAASYEKSVGIGVAWVGSNDPKAVWQELGTHRGGRTLPPRPVLGIAAARLEPQIRELAGKEVVSYLMSPHRGILTRRHEKARGATGTTIPVLKGK